MVNPAHLNRAASGLRVRPSHPPPTNTNMKYINTITQISVGMENDNPIYGECVRIRLEDECGGMFLVFAQDDENNVNEVRIGLDEWDNICQAVLMLKNQQLVK